MMELARLGYVDQNSVNLFESLKNEAAVRAGYARLTAEEGLRYREAARVLNAQLRELMPRLDRPSAPAATEQRDEFAPFHHSITSSARASSVGGTSRPSNFAVGRLMASSYFEACSTGRSAGFVPFRILSM
jgi:hypothetical protein